MDIRSLILPKQEEETNETALAEKKNAAKKRADVKYTIELESGCDFAISRTTVKTRQLLVVLMSQEQFYIKDEKTGKITELAPESLTKFLSDTEDGITLRNVNWLDHIGRGKAAADEFFRYLKPEYCKAARKGLLYVSDDAACWRSSSTWAQSMVDNSNLNMTLYAWCLDLMASRLGMDRKAAVAAMLTTREHSKMENITKKFESIAFLAEELGIEWAKQYVINYLDSACSDIPDVGLFKRMFYEVINRNGWYRGQEQFTYGDRHTWSYKASRYVEYITYECCRQGYADNPASFIIYWDDTLRMQMDIYGKIRDKYPENLLTIHQQLIYIRNRMKEEVDRKKWDMRAAHMAGYEWKPAGSKYQIIAPKRPEDMLDEAQQQQNCLASYVKRVIAGECMIFFLRSAKEEKKDRSLVTIELFYDGSLGQVLAKNNRQPEHDQLEFVQRWVDKIVRKNVA